MRDVAPHRVPTWMQEENARHILECAEAFDILIAPLRLDPPELLQRGDYLGSSPDSNEDIDSIRAMCARVSIHQYNQYLTVII